MRKQAMLAAAISVVAILTIGGAVYAAIPDSSDGVIHACYGSNGEVRVIDVETSPPQTCGKGWTPVSWNQQGVKGDVGPTGPTGPQGPPGTVATSNAYFASLTTDFGKGQQGVLFDSNGDRVTVLTLQVPAGSYIVEARAYANFDGDFGYCYLPGGSGANFAPTSPPKNGFISTNQLELTTAITVTNPRGGPSTLTLTCYGIGGFENEVTDATLLATPVGAVNPAGG